MKRLWLLVVMLFLAACGGGGDGGTSGTDVSGLKMGTLNIQVSQAPAKMAAAVTETATTIRFVVTNPALKISGQPFKVVQDVPIGSATSGVQIALPIYNGYLIEALKYATDANNTQYKVAKSYASATADITAVTDPPPSVALTLNDVTASVAVTAPAGQGFIYAHIPGDTAQDKYNVRATIGKDTDGNTALDVCRIHVSLNDFTSTQYTGTATTIATAAGTIAAGTDVPAPDAFVGGTLHIQPVFNVKASLLTKGESPNYWTFTGDTKVLTMKIKGAVTLGDGNWFVDNVPPTVNLSVPAFVNSDIIPLTLTATDNGRITGYKIWQTAVATTAGAVADAALGDADIPAFAVVDNTHSLPPSYTVAGPLVTGTDYYLKVYVLVTDQSGHTALATSPVVHVRK